MEKPLFHAEKSSRAGRLGAPAGAKHERIVGKLILMRSPLEINRQMRKAMAPAHIMRFFKFSFFIYGLLLIFVLTKIPIQHQNTASFPVELGITVVALIDIVIGFCARQLFGRAIKKRNPAANPLKIWISVNLVSLSFFISSSLFGFALYFIGARTELVAVLMGAGLVSILLWNPGTPPRLEEGKLPLG